jgi:DNA (cytosine-5)-methyltransferase 1
MTGHVSLCSGIGGLDIPIGTPDEFWENADAPSDVLAYQYPGIPNYGDWTQLDRFDSSTTFVSGGLPCQPVSQAGRRLGSKDERYLFDELGRILQASEARPQLWLENVRGLLHKRHRVMFSRFLRRLAELGYDVQWHCVRASDAGAPHRRERVFLLASWNADSTGLGCEECPPGNSEETGVEVEGGGELGGRGLSASNTGSSGRNQRSRSRKSGETPVGRDGFDHPDGRLAALRASPYGPAIARWEALTRPCPPPLREEDQRLSAEYVEWHMGYPAGWVTDVLGRANAIKALGNAVVPQQAALAYALMNEEIE